MQCPNCYAYLENLLQCLRADDAVKNTRGKIICTGQIRDDSRLEISFILIQDVAFRDPIPAVLERIRVIFDLKDVALDIWCPI
jgi:hypothetical protein